MLWTVTLLASTLTIAPREPALVPRPVESRFTGGTPFVVTDQTRLISDCAATKHLKAMFQKAAGFNLEGSGRKGTIVFRHKKDTARLRPDWYWLDVRPGQVLVEYSSESGAFYAVQTLRQLLPEQIESPKPVKGVTWSLPACSVSDGPRFGWRGMMLDVSRHFFPVSFIKRQLDTMALLKLNVFHWHLVDDGGWRIEIKKYPKLTSTGAWRVDTGEVWPGGEWNFGNIQICGDQAPKKYGGFYTQEDIKEIVRYAADRHITVVPEIELPGHSLGAVVSYPELKCLNVGPPAKPGQSLSNVYCAGNDAAITFLEDVLTETLALFPSKFVHIGADEVEKKHWRACPRCQARMKANGLKDENELQSWVVRHFDTFLSDRGRRLVGWDEILEGGLAPGATVMSWRGVQGGIDAAKQGRDVVMSPTSHCYFDYSYQAIPTQHVYAYDPVPAGLTPEQAARVLGGQYNVWAEWIATEARNEELQYPRALAMAEVLWSPKEGRKWSEFSPRMTSFLPRLDALGLNVHVSEPEVDATAVFFSGRTTVKAKGGGPGRTLRYTMDGSVPNGKSPVYRNGVTVTRPTTVTFAFVNKRGIAGPVSRVECRNPRNKDLGPLTPGLRADTYLLNGEPSRLPDLKTMKASGTSVTSVFDQAVRPRPAQFAVRWSGILRVPETGAYNFYLTSDDGSRLWLDDALVVDNDGPHGAVEKSGRAWLEKGDYRVDVRWYDQGGANSFKFEMAAPSRPKAPVPETWLFRTAGA
ncbi:MAG: family 20 glycosylhydrolase [Armatimonadetes bacterium]|nr:family 20 glycosylhydrolase [Armatimonadota bacterium]